MQVFLQLNGPLGPSLGPNFNLTADVGLVFPATATGASLLAGILVNVNALATVITVTSTGVCTNSIQIPIGFASTTTTTTSDPGICFTYTEEVVGSLLQTTQQTILPGALYAGKPTYSIPGIGIVYWSPSQLRWEYATLLDSGTLLSTLNYSGPKPISGSPNNWVLLHPTDNVIASSLAPCPATTTTTSSTTSTSSTTTSTSTSTSTTTSTSSTTTTSTAAPNCCPPTITSLTLNSTTGLHEVTYTLGGSPPCIACSAIRLEFSTDGGFTWTTGNISSCGTMITSSLKPSGTKFRLVTLCSGGSISNPSNVVTYSTVVPCLAGSPGGTPCCTTSISVVTCNSSSPLPGLGGNGSNLTIVLGSSSPIDCGCVSAWFVQYRRFADGPSAPWIPLGGGSPRTSSGGRIIIDDIYNFLPLDNSAIEIRIRATCTDSTVGGWSNVFTFTPCVRYRNTSTSPVLFPGSSITLPPGGCYCFAGNTPSISGTGIIIEGWCWEDCNLPGACVGFCSCC